MEVIFNDKEHDRLETDPKYTASRSPYIVKTYRKRMQIIRAAPDERDFYKMKSLHYEKLHGNRSHQHSMKINDQFRLIIELVKESQGAATKVKIIGIEDYH